MCALQAAAPLHLPASCLVVARLPFCIVSACTPCKVSAVACSLTECAALEDTTLCA